MGREREGEERESKARDKMESWVREKRLMKVGREKEGCERGSGSVARGER